MQKQIMSVLVAAAFAFAAFAESLTLKVSADREDCLYRCGEKATFTVSALGTNGLAVTAGAVKVRVDNFGEKTQSERTVDLAKANPFTVSGVLDEPGFLRIKVSAADSKNVVFGVGYEPERIRPGGECPADFDQFWAEAIRKCDAEVPLDVQISPAPEWSNDKVEVSKVSFATCNGRRVYGWISVPKKGKGPWPLRVQMPGAGWGGWSNCPRRPDDAIGLFMAVYPFEPLKDWMAFQTQYKEWNDGLKAKYGASGYSTSGIAVSREEYFYYPVILGINRAVNWAAARADVDRTQITYSGTSQGGGFGLILLALNRNFSRGAIFVPGSTDLFGSRIGGRQSGWPLVVDSQKPENRAAAEKNAPYFDCANFAARIKVPVRVVVGFADVTCAPCAVYAGYNMIPSKDKQIFHGIGMSHSVFPRFYAQLGEWERETVSTVVEAGIVKFMAGRSDNEAKAAAEAAYNMEATDKTYYVAPDGDDSRSGLSPAEAWRTIAKVNAAEIAPGAKVLFKRGGVYRGNIEVHSGKPGAVVYYGAYGEGAKPALQMSVDGTGAAKWRKVGEDLWEMDTKATSDVGNIIFNDGVDGCAFRRGKKEELRNDLDYYCEKKTFKVTLKSNGNPGLRFKSVELAVKIHGVNYTCAHDVVFEGLHVRYTAAHGFGGSGTKRLTIRGCDISWIGGGYLYYDKLGNGVRYGNGIEFWSAAEDHVVESNRLWEVWDAALTNQSSRDDVVQRNIIYRGNEVWNSEYSFEYWQQGDRARTEDVVVEGNRFRDAGKGWGHRQRWNPNAGHLMFYDTTAETRNFIIRDNVFSRTEDCGLRLFNAWHRTIEWRNNVWDIQENLICRYHGRPTSNLEFKYPDRLDKIHDDNLAEIESQLAEQPRVFKAGELNEFLDFLGCAK